jgi:hypothetical protein
MDVFTLKKLAGHARIETTMRYIHMNDTRARTTLEKVWKAQKGHKNGRSAESNAAVPVKEMALKANSIR